MIDNWLLLLLISILIINGHMDTQQVDKTNMCFPMDIEAGSESLSPAITLESQSPRNVDGGNSLTSSVFTPTRSVSTSLAVTTVSYTERRPRISTVVGVYSSPIQPNFTVSYRESQLSQATPTGQSNSQSISRVPMTVSSKRTNSGSGTGKMDSNFLSSDYTSISPSHACGDQCFNADFTDTSIYASSPNSLYSYDQEKVDMQITLGGPTCTTCTANSTLFSDDFELKAQYEASRDFAMPIAVATLSGNSSTISATVGSEGQDGSGWNGKVEDGLLTKTGHENKTGPTLAELNFELLDEIDSYINVDMLNSKSLQETSGLTTRDKSVPSNSSYTEMTRVTEDITNGKMLMKNLNSTNVKRSPPPLINYSSSVRVKTELVDMDFANAGYGGMTTHTPRTGSGSMPAQSNTALQKLLSKPSNVPKAATDAILTQMLRKVPEIPANGTSRKRTVSTASIESMDEKWEDIKQFIQGPSDALMPVERKARKRVDSCSSVLTMTSNEDLESNQGDDSDSDHNDFDDSQSDSDMEGGCDLISLDPSESLVGRSKEKQYFWQYNVQSKGPKGTRVHFEMEEDPHVLRIFEDPVFDPATSSVAGVGIGIKHGGKARKGDGNDIVPNPKRLCQIGLQLRKISRHINDFAPVSELPSPMRSKKRKEKNKLASRACRLKKKAQHEAHKVKLYGLELEHCQLLKVLRNIQQELVERVKNKSKRQSSVLMADRLEQLMQENLSAMIAGNTTDFVNTVVRKVEAGDPTGGIEVKATRSYPKELHN